MLQKSLHPELMYKEGASSRKRGMCTGLRGASTGRKGVKIVLIVAWSFCLLNPRLLRDVDHLPCSVCMDSPWHHGVLALSATAHTTSVKTELSPATAHSSKTCGVISPYKHLARINFITAEIWRRILSPSLVPKPQPPVRPPALSCPVFSLFPSLLITTGWKVPTSSAPGWWPQRAEAATQGGTPELQSPHCHSARVPPYPLLSKGQPEVCAGELMGEQHSPAIPATA